MGPRLRARVPGAARAEATMLGSRPVVVVEVDPTDRRGALSASASGTIAAAARLAVEVGRPLVLVLGSSGADLGEGMAALHGWGVAARAVAACSGIVPIVVVVDGPAVSGTALLLGLADHVVMTADSYAFVSGPAMVAEYTGIQVGNHELGGADVHDRAAGVATAVAADRADALALVVELLDHLPLSTDHEVPRAPATDPPSRSTPELRDVLPASPTGSYDVRAVMRSVVDHGELLEVRAGWATNLVTALARIAGRAVGLIGNQPFALAGTLDIAASQKGARFVNHCDVFNLPIVTFVDTPGFSPGKDLEWRGMIRHGAQLVHAYARATVPRVCVILRKSYGGAYIVMDSKTMGNDHCVAWPTAEIAVMGARGAVGIVHRRASDEERASHEREYEARFLTPYLAAERGFVDAVIDPADTRAEVARALENLSSKRERLVARKVANSPL